MVSYRSYKNEQNDKSITWVFSSLYSSLCYGHIFKTIRKEAIVSLKSLKLCGILCNVHLSLIISVWLVFKRK